MIKRFLPFQKMFPIRKLWIWVFAVIFAGFMTAGCTPVISTSDAAEMENGSPQETQVDFSGKVKSPTPTIQLSGEEPNFLKSGTPMVESRNPTSPSPEEQLEFVKTPKVNPGSFSKSYRAPISGDVPEDILQDIIQDLTERIGADSDDIEVIRSEFVTWNDGSLGCPQKGMYYTQALIDGYWVILKIEGVEFDYRVTVSGQLILCEGRGNILFHPLESKEPKE